MKKYIAKTTDDLHGIAKKLISDFEDNRVIAFYGEMGAGKTTLIKELCQVLGVQDTASSPTFSIVNEYFSDQNNTIYHFDFYRIEREEEVMDLGYEDYFYGGDYCFVEWPEKIPHLLPQNAVKLEITLDDLNHRLIVI